MFCSSLSFKNLDEDRQIQKIPENLENVFGHWGSSKSSLFFGIIMKFLVFSGVFGISGSLV